MATTGSDPARELLRHTVATLAYRGGKVLRGAPEGFAEFKAGPTSRTAGQMLAHICDLLDCALSQAKGKEEWHNSEPLRWQKGAERFFAGLQEFDAYLASDLPLGVLAGRLFQGGIADALTHVGQLAFLRRLAAAPVRAENYARAEIVVGRVGAEQSAPKREFD